MKKVTKKEMENGSMWIDSICRTKDSEKTFILGQVENFDVEVGGEVHKWRIFEDWPNGLTFQDLTRGEQISFNTVKFPKRCNLKTWFNEIDSIEDMFFCGYGKKIGD